MEARVARLEADMQEVKGVLSRLEPVIMRMDTMLRTILPTVATKSDVEAVCAEIRTDRMARQSALAGDPRPS
jgi:hypothetical protein